MGAFGRPVDMPTVVPCAVIEPARCGPFQCRPATMRAANAIIATSASTPAPSPTSGLGLRLSGICSPNGPFCHNRHTEVTFLCAGFHAILDPIAHSTGRGFMVGDPVRAIWYDVPHFRPITAEHFLYLPICLSGERAQLFDRKAGQHAPGAISGRL